MEKISVRLLVLAAAIVAPSILGSADQAALVKHVEEMSTEELSATAKAEQYCVYFTADIEEHS